MPVVTYTVQIENDTFSETDTFPPTGDAHQYVTENILGPWNQSRAALDEPHAVLVKVVVQNPFVHRHDWKLQRQDKYAGKSYYYCQRCQITGWRKLKVFEGEVGGINRDEPYKNERKYADCHDPLTQLPKKLTF
jgi:hypothetical protein